MYVCLLGAQLKVQTLTLEPRMRQATEISSQKFRWTRFYKICCYKLFLLKHKVWMSNLHESCNLPILRGHLFEYTQSHTHSAFL